MLVDMAGSENIEAAGQTGFEAKMQVCDASDTSSCTSVGSMCSNFQLHCKHWFSCKKFLCHTSFNS